MDKTDRNAPFSNICENEGLEYFKDKISQEHKNWLELFTNPDIDPRDVIGQEIGRSKEEVKEALNQAINGNLKFTRILDWIKNKFPCLYAVWQTINVKATGSNIGKFYETKIMLNKELYQLTEAQGVKIAYEYDGVSVFCSDVGTLLIDKLDYLAKRIRSIGERECGIRLVLKVEIQ
jgi:hypothetical protein